MTSFHTRIFSISTEVEQRMTAVSCGASIQYSMAHNAPNVLLPEAAGPIHVIHEFSLKDFSHSSHQ